MDVREMDGKRVIDLEEMLWHDRLHKQVGQLGLCLDVGCGCNNWLLGLCLDSCLLELKQPLNEVDIVQLRVLCSQLGLRGRWSWNTTWCTSFQVYSFKRLEKIECGWSWIISPQLRIVQIICWRKDGHFRLFNWPWKFWTSFVESFFLMLIVNHLPFVLFSLPHDLFVNRTTGPPNHLNILHNIQAQMLIVKVPKEKQILKSTLWTKTFSRLG